MKNQSNQLIKSHALMRRAAGFAVPAIALQCLALAATVLAGPREGNRAPTLPAGAEHLQAPAGNKVAFRAYAAGVQIYVCRNTSSTETPQYEWVFEAPEAELFANANLTGEIGIHYAGPTWESNSGAKVVGARVAGETVDPDAIPWLLLRVVSSQGPGIFREITYIQRVNTSGGLAPTTECSGENEGEEVGVPYTAEYFFYSSSEH